MKHSVRLLAGLVGLATLSSTALAQRGFWNRDACDTPVSRNNSNVGFSISIGNTRGWHSDRYWGSNRGFSRAGHDFWIGNRGRNNSHWRNSHWNTGHWNGGHWNNGWRRPVVHQPVVVCPTPVVRTQPVVVQHPVFVERPVVIERTTVYEQPTYEPIVRDAPTYHGITAADPAQRYRAGWNALALGDLAYAREFFTDQAIRRPDDPTPKAGLAIARAATGLDDQAEWAMRRAVRAGFARARQGVPGLDLEATLVSLEERYTTRSETYNDRWFMLAATRYLLGDSAGAKEAAGQALLVDERDGDARRLYDLVAHTG